MTRCLRRGGSPFLPRPLSSGCRLFKTHGVSTWHQKSEGKPHGKREEFKARGLDMVQTGARSSLYNFRQSEEQSSCRKNNVHTATEVRNSYGGRSFAFFVKHVADLHTAERIGGGKLRSRVEQSAPLLSPRHSDSLSQVGLLATTSCKCSLKSKKT